MWIRCFYAEAFAQKPRINQISRTSYGFPVLKVPGAELSVTGPSLNDPRPFSGNGEAEGPYGGSPGSI